MRQRQPANPGARLGMPLSAWPEADRAAWEAAFRPTRGFSFGASPGVKLRPPTRDAILNGYARWLLWIRDHAPAVLGAPPAGRATQVRVCAYLEAIQSEIVARTLLEYGCRLRRALELMCPGEDWTWFGPLIRGLQQHARDNRKEERPFVPSGQLYAYGVALMDAAEALPACRDVVRAEQFRNGLMIAFLATRPLRLKNMAQLELSTQLVESADGYNVTIQPDETKTRRTLEFPVPATLVPAVRRYLAFHRKILAAGAADGQDTTTGQPDYVWLARSGARLPADTFGDMITKRTLTRFGQRLTPHEFRHCAASSIAEFDPENWHFIRIILGHTSSATGDKYYVRAKGMEAARLYQAELRRKRKELANLATPKRSRAAYPTASGASAAQDPANAAP